MSDTLRAAAQQALGTLERCALRLHDPSFVALPIDALRAALAAAVAEPVAIHQWRKRLCAEWYDGHPDHDDGGGPYETRTLYAAPPQREPLTEEQIEELNLHYLMTQSAKFTIVRAVERAHGITKEQP